MARLLKKVGDGATELLLSAPWDRDKIYVHVPDQLRCSGITRHALVTDIFGAPHNWTDTAHMASRLILVANKYAEADAFNAWMAEQLPGEMQVVLASNAVVQTAGDNAVVPPEVLASSNPSCMSPHKLHLKPGVVLILLRNIDVDQGLCNGTRLTLEQVSRHTLKCRTLGGGAPRLPRTAPKDGFHR